MLHVLKVVYVVGHASFHQPILHVLKVNNETFRTQTTSRQEYGLFQMLEMWGALIVNNGRYNRGGHLVVRGRNLGVRANSPSTVELISCSPTHYKPPFYGPKIFVSH